MKNPFEYHRSSDLAPRPHQGITSWRLCRQWLTQLCLITVLVLLVWPPMGQAADWRRPLIQSLKGGAAMVADPSGKTLFEQHGNRPMVPASIIKIATADAALTLLGEDYRFKTEFYLAPTGELAVKGYGDPGLVSEQLDAIAQRLAALDLPLLQGFVFDTSYFAAHLSVQGRSQTDNPYDAHNGALVANFNTVYVRKRRHGRIDSAEPQTPLTPTALKLAGDLSAGEHRINIGQGAEAGLKYFSELLRAFLQRQGVAIPPKFRQAAVPSGSRLLFTHRSPPLSGTVQGLLKYSNNFIANQLLLVLGAERMGPPATLEKGRRVVAGFLTGEVGLRGFRLAEGSGLSRRNRIDAREMITLLRHFAPYKDLLKVRDQRFYAKTGTLKGVSTYAGFMQSPVGKYYPFVILLDRPVGFNYRFGIAHKLYRHLVE